MSHETVRHTQTELSINVACDSKANRQHKDRKMTDDFATIAVTDYLTFRYLPAIDSPVAERCGARAGMSCTPPTAAGAAKSSQAWHAASVRQKINCRRMPASAQTLANSVRGSLPHWPKESQLDV